MDETHLKELLDSHSLPPPSQVRSAPVTIVNLQMKTCLQYYRRSPKRTWLKWVFQCIAPDPTISLRFAFGKELSFLWRSIISTMSISIFSHSNTDPKTARTMPSITASGYFCPQCQSKYCSVPVECQICGRFACVLVFF